VNREQGLESLNGTKIDFDLGHGKVGIETKLAKSILKTASLQRLVGQLRDYTESKYKSNNLVVIVFGTSEEENERVALDKIKERIEANGAIYTYITIPDLDLE
jgi:ABC-type bacteriocin/lantibiotic exporter with double-glycine peptidase domain